MGMDSSGDEGATGYDRYREMLIENLELKGENDRIKSELDKVKKDLENKDSEWRREQRLRIATEEVFQKEMKRSQKLREKIRQLQNQITGQGQQAVASLSIDQRRNPEPENLVSTTTEVIPTRQIRRPSNTNSDVSSTAEDNRNLPIHSLVPGIFNPPQQQQPVSQRIAHEPKKRSQTEDGKAMERLKRDMQKTRKQTNILSTEIVAPKPKKCIESLPAKELEAVMEETRTEILDDQPTGNNIRNQIAAQRLKKMKETESKAAQKKRKLSSEINIKTENEAKKRKEALLSPSSSSSSLSPKKTVVSTSVPPPTAPITPKMSSEEKNKILKSRAKELITEHKLKRGGDLDKTILRKTAQECNVSTRLLTKMIDLVINESKNEQEESKGAKKLDDMFDGAPVADWGAPVSASPSVGSSGDVLMKPPSGNVTTKKVNERVK